MAAASQLEHEATTDGGTAPIPQQSRRLTGQAQPAVALAPVDVFQREHRLPGLGSDHPTANSINRHRVVISHNIAVAEL